MTDTGAYACYRALADRLPSIFGSERITLEQLQRVSSRLVGDLGIRLDEVADEPVEYLRVIDPKTTKAASARLPVGRVDVYENPDRTLPRAVWFGDSHSFALLPFVSQHFSRLVSVHTDRFLFDLVEIEKPDVVISQISEVRIAYPMGRDQLDVVRLPEDGLTDGLLELYQAGKLSCQGAPAFFKLDLSANDDNIVSFSDGWSGAEPGQRWSVGGESLIRVPLPSAPGSCTLRLEVHPFLLATRLEMQRLTVMCSDVVVAHYDLRGELKADIEIDQPTLAAAAEGNTVVIRFLHPDAASPSDFGGTDRRQLAMCFRKLELAGGTSGA